MAADERFENDSKDRVPIFDINEPANWEREFSIFLMRHKQAQKAFEPKTKALLHGRETLIKKREEEIEQWEERNEIAYSYVYKAVANVPAAWEIATTYHDEVINSQREADEPEEQSEQEDNIDEQPPIVRRFHLAKELIEKLVSHF